MRIRWMVVVAVLAWLGLSALVFTRRKVRRSLAFVAILRGNVLRKAGVLVAVGLAAALGLSGKADAGVINVTNYTSASGIGITTWNAKNISGATEGYGAGDASFITPIQDNALEIYSNVEGNLLSTDARPISTNGFPFKLAIKGTVSNISNSLVYVVSDSTDLTNPAIIIGGNTYPLNMDGDYHSIPLPNVSGTNTQYLDGQLQLIEGTWENPAVPEPAGLALLGLGALALRRSRIRS